MCFALCCGSGITVLYFVAAAGNLSILFPNTVGLRFWIVVCAFCVLPLVLVPKLEHVASASFAGTASVVLVAFLVVAESFEVQDINGQTHALETSITLANVLAGFSTIVFAYGVSQLLSNFLTCTPPFV